MGHGVKPEEFIPEGTPRVAQQIRPRYRSSKIINTAVSGYGVNQEYSYAQGSDEIQS